MDIELSRAVASIRDELRAAADEAAGQEILFRADSIELEFAVELRADAKAKTGFKPWVLSAEVEAGVARGRTHRVTVSLSPRLANGDDVLINSSGRRPEGAGDLSGRIEE